MKKIIDIFQIIYLNKCKIFYFKFLYFIKNLNYMSTNIKRAIFVIVTVHSIIS